MSDTVDTNGRKRSAARLYFEVFGKGNLAAADDILAAEVISHGPGGPTEIGRDGIKRQATVLRTAIPDLAVSLEDQLSESDRVASRWRANGTLSGPLRLPGVDISPTGAPIEFTEIRIDRFVGDRIVESWFIPDRLSLWQQLGLVPSQ
jgi:predicted ester cyclase